MLRIEEDCLFFPLYLVKNSIEELDFVQSCLHFCSHFCSFLIYQNLFYNL